MTPPWLQSQSSNPSRAWATRGEGTAIDPISHAVIGSAIAALVPTGTSAGVTTAVLLGAELPDIDIVAKYLWGQSAYLQLHRGPTHGVLSLLVGSAVLAGLLHLIWPAVGLWVLFTWAMAGCLSHVLFDFCNDYGTQGLWPFSRRKIAFDLIPIIDLWVFGVILGGWVVHWLWPGHRQEVFLGVWGVLLAYLGFRFWLHNTGKRLVSAQFRSEHPAQEHVPSGDGWHPEQISIHPTLLSLNAWRYVVRTESAYMVGTVWVFNGLVGSPMTARDDQDKLVKASLQSHLVTEFACWARRPRAEVRAEGELYRVQWSEVRYERHGFSPFTAYAVLDQNLNLVDEGLGSTRPPNMDRHMITEALLSEMGRRD